METKKSSLSTASLVLGIVGICTSFIPIINYLSFVMGILAFIFGIIGLVKGAGKGKNITAIILGILTFIIVINMHKALSDTISTISDDLNTLSSNVTEQSNQDKQEEIMEVDYTVLHQEYMDNPISADAKYKGKMLKLTGEVYNIDREIAGNTYITFNIGGQYSIKNVRITFKKSEESKVAQLKKGQTVTIKGQCTGTLLSTTVALKDCEIID